MQRILYITHQRLKNQVIGGIWLIKTLIGTKEISICPLIFLRHSSFYFDRCQCKISSGIRKNDRFRQLHRIHWAVDIPTKKNATNFGTLLCCRNCMNETILLMTIEGYMLSLKWLGIFEIQLLTSFPHSFEVLTKIPFPDRCRRWIDFFHHF